MKEKAKAFVRLVEIMDRLREECPWDQKQTINSLRYLTIEEVYELSDAILDEDFQEIKKELGDLLLHIVFYSRIASEKQEFDITDVLNNIGKQDITYHVNFDCLIRILKNKEHKFRFKEACIKRCASS